MWYLFTTEPIETPDDVERIVQRYATRWRVEEFFKELKTSCAYEARQVESYEALLVLLAMLLPITTELLRLRTLTLLRGSISLEQQRIGYRITLAHPSTRMRVQS